MPTPLEELSILLYALLIFAGGATQAGYMSLTAGARERTMRLSDRQDARQEESIMHLPLALLAVSVDISTGWTWGAAFVAILSRGIYVLAFYLSSPDLSTFMWAADFFAVPAMAVDILFGAA